MAALYLLAIALNGEVSGRLRALLVPSPLLYFAARFLLKSKEENMDFRSGQTIKVTISKPVSRAAARKTLERLFMKDQGVARPLAARADNFVPLPRRRGGRIWTKHPNKIHPNLVKGTVATLKVTAQVIKDLKSVEDMVQVASA